MKKIALLIAVTFLFIGGRAFATTYKVSGISNRTGPVAKYLHAKGCGVTQLDTGTDVMGSLKGKPWPGVQVSSGAGSDVFIPVSDTATNGLCKDQTNLLDSLATVCKGIAKDATPYCPDGSSKCWPPNARGQYETLVPHEGIRTVRNTDPQKLNNALSVKVEGYRDRIPRDGWTYGAAPIWGPTIVLRNVNDLPVAQQLLNDPRVVPYAQCIATLKRGAPVHSNGEVCYEVTIGLDGVVVKNDSPPECPF